VFLNNVSSIRQTYPGSDNSESGVSGPVANAGVDSAVG